MEDEDYSYIDKYWKMWNSVTGNWELSFLRWAENWVLPSKLRVESSLISNSIQLDSTRFNVDTTTLKRSPTHKNQRDLTCGPYHRYVPTCSFNNSVLTIDHGQNVVNQKTLARHEEVANNNVSYHKFYCLRRGPRTNIATMVVWVNAELFQNVLCGLIYRFRPRCCPPSPSLRQRKQNKTNL